MAAEEMISRVGFPAIGLELEINRVAFRLPFSEKPIYWYAIIIAVGFLLAVWYGQSRAKKLGSDKNQILDVLIWALPIALICARAYYVIFHFDRYRDNLISMLYIWEGGMAIYGGVIGGVVTACIYCRIKKLKLLPMLDVAALGFLIGQAIGRWGNFVNSEAYGSQTELPWRMTVYEAQRQIAVHPTFLYESLWNAIGFLILHFYSKKRKFEGEIFLLYIVWYGLGRGFIEGLRTDSLYLFSTGIRVSQMVGFVSFVVAGVILVINYVRLRRETCERLHED